MNKFKRLFDYLSLNTGWNITSYDQAFLLYVGLKTEEENGLELPEWTKSIYPEPIKQFAIKSFEIFTATTELKRLAAGLPFKNI